MSRTVRQEILLDATPERVFEAYMDSRKHAAFTAHGDADISRDAGAPFSCHGGEIVGRTIETVANRRIVQAWRVAGWDAGVYSLVRIDLIPEGAKTRLVLEHSALPEGSEDHIDSGWHERYWDPLRKYLAQG